MNVSTPQEMRELGARYAAKAKPGDTFALVGKLGAGKTQWTQGFIGSLDTSIAVTSPTFSLVNEYRGGRFPLFHFDFYRLKTVEELLSLGWDEYLDEKGIIICEWADLFPQIMPVNTYWLQINYHTNGTRCVSQIKGETENL